MASGLAVSGVSVVPTEVAVPEPSMTFEFNELKRKLERKELDLKRKEKDAAGFQREIARLNKEMKHSAAELESLRERNEQLQQSLMTMKVQNQKSKVESEDTRQAAARIRDLEAALSSAAHKYNMSEGELEASKKSVHILEERLHASLNELDDLRSEMAKREKVAARNEEDFRIATASVEDKDVIIQGMKATIVTLTSKSESQAAQIAELTSERNAHRSSIAELKKELKHLKSMLVVRNETNESLQSQLDDLNSNRVFLSKEDIERYKSIEVINNSLQQRLKDAVSSLDLHMDLLSKSEDAVSKSKLLEESLQKRLMESNAVIMEQEARQKDDSDMIKQLKRDVARLNTVRDELEARLSDLGEGRERDLQIARDGFQQLARTKQEEAEARQQEMRRRKLAEDASKALKNRISFLLDQLDLASRISQTWQEQKELLTSQLSGALRANQITRQKLLEQARSAGAGRVVSNGASPNRVNDSTLREDGRLAGETAFLTGLDDDNVTFPSTPNRSSSHAQVHLDSDNHKTAESSEDGGLPSTPAGLVERALFDVLCAFSTGSRKEAKKAVTKRKSKKAEPLAQFKMIQTDNGLYDIDVMPGEGDVEASELLNSLQINSFLLFCQGRSVAKMPALFTEKIASLLNFHRTVRSDVVEQLAEVRLEQARSMSRLAVGVDLLQRLKKRCSSERFGKQKGILRSVQEQLRGFSLRVSVDVASKALAELEDSVRQAGAPSFRPSEDPRVQMELDNIVQNVAGGLRNISDCIADGVQAAGMTGSASVLGGGLEIRLIDQQVDDETLHLVLTQLADSSSACAKLDVEPQKVNLSNLHHVNLSNSVYTNNLILLNLKGNSLTDLSCKMLSPLLEQTYELRMLDLRENALTAVGIKQLFDSTRRNPSILYVTKKQSGSMIEGSRELSSDEGNLPTDANSSGNPKHPLRIDVRQNSASKASVVDVLDLIDNTADPSTALSADSRKATPGRSESQSRRFVGQIEKRAATIAFIDSEREDVGESEFMVSTSRSRPKSAGVVRSTKRPPLPRPASAAQAGLRGLQQVRSRRSQSLQSSDDEDDNVEDILAHGTGDGMKTVKSQVAAGSGSMLEEHIRRLQESVITAKSEQNINMRRRRSKSPASRHTSPQVNAAPSVKERLRSITKAVYHNKPNYAPSSKSAQAASTQQPTRDRDPPALQTLHTLGTTGFSGLIDREGHSELDKRDSLPLTVPLGVSRNFRKPTPTLRERTAALSQTALSQTAPAVKSSSNFSFESIAGGDVGAVRRGDVSATSVQRSSQARPASAGHMSKKLSKLYHGQRKNTEISIEGMLEGISRLNPATLF